MERYQFAIIMAHFDIIMMMLARTFFFGMCFMVLAIIQLLFAILFYATEKN